MKHGRILWGMFFILAAVYLILGKMGAVPDVGVFSIILTVFMIWLFLEGIRKTNFYEILFSIAFVLIIYDKPLGITDYTPWTVLGAALLLSIGLSMIFQGRRKKKWSVNIGKGGIEFSPDGEGKKKKKDGAWDEAACDGERVCCENNFGSTIRYINSDNFCAADLENNFGSLSVYFDNAVIQSPVAYVKVDNNFGETKLYLPKSWHVEEDISATGGSVDYHGKYEGSSQFVLRIEGDTSFGSVEIYYI